MSEKMTKAQFKQWTKNYLQNLKESVTALEIVLENPDYQYLLDSIDQFDPALRSLLVELDRNKLNQINSVVKHLSNRLEN